MRNINYQTTVNTEGITHIIVEMSENTYKSFPADNSNPSYISFLRQLSEENPDDPHYLEWVEAGNNPEDFWTQPSE